MDVFVQVIKGRTNDAAGMRRQMESWERDLRPGAKGFLGSTTGYLPDGTVIALARFESREAAEANSKRPEQTAWWNETEKYMEGTPEFLDSTEIDVLHDGGSNKATFVQIMDGRCTNPKRMRELNQSPETSAILAKFRPELLGGVTVWDGDRYVEAAYFTDEASARNAEKSEPPPEAMAMLEEWQSLSADVTYLDITDPVLT